MKSRSVEEILSSTSMAKSRVELYSTPKHAI